ncbi:AarF/UbiB family protein, partial [Clostridium perfringens]
FITRPDLLPKAYIEELEKFQDNNEIPDFHKVKEIFYESFGKDINTYFLEFSENPLASPSIAQVHRAQ